MQPCAAAGALSGRCPWTPLGAPCGGLPAPHMQFAKVVARRRQGGFLQLPCSLGFRLAFSATGGARLRPPAAFKKAGENWLEIFFGFPAEGAGPPLIGSGGLVLWVGFRGGKRLANGSLGLRKIPASPGGRRRAQSALKERRPGPPLFCLAAGAALRAAPACQTPPPPRTAGIFLRPIDPSTTLSSPGFLQTNLARRSR